MQTSKVKNGFDKLSEAALATEASFILSKMSGNPFFNNSQPTVNLVKEASNVYVQALDKAKEGGRENVARKNAARMSLITIMRQLGAEIMAEAAGNNVAIESSGYPVFKNKTNTPALVKPVAPVLKSQANPGEILCKGKKQKGAKTMMFYLTDNLTTPTWKPYATSGSKVIVSGLTSAKVYYAKYALFGVRNQEVESDVISYVVQ